MKYFKNLLEVTNVIVWTDGAVGQYKCRQNFYSLATQFEEVKVTHKFAATSQFKGVHDKIGQVAKHVVQQAEKASLEHARCSTAWKWYCCCRDEMSKPK
jgi:6-phosphogluconate dehydrogenase